MVSMSKCTRPERAARTSIAHSNVSCSAGQSHNMTQLRNEPEAFQCPLNPEISIFQCCSPASWPSKTADCCVHFWCTECAQCQEIRELKARGALTTGKPNHVGPNYSHTSGHGQPTSPANQQLLQQPGAAGIPVAAPPEYERIPQVVTLLLGNTVLIPGRSGTN